MNRLNYLCTLLCVAVGVLLVGCDASDMTSAIDDGVASKGGTQEAVGTLMSLNGSEPLYAGQNILIGYVSTTDDGADLSVTYNITETGWCMTESHVHVGESLDDFPLKNGNPPPGQFDYSAEHDPCVTSYTYTIPFAEIGAPMPGDDLLIATHADVYGTGGLPLGCGFIHGIQRDTGFLYEVNPLTGTFNKIFEPTGLSNGGDFNYPNGLAYDEPNNRLYYNDKAKNLYAYDFLTNSQVDLGDIQHLNAGATYFEGAYYYIPQSTTDDLHKVTITGNAVTNEEVILTNFTGEPNRKFNFGDMVMRWENGNLILYFSSVTPAEFAKIDLTNGTYQVLTNDLPEIGGGTQQQLTFGPDGKLYGHRTQIGSTPNGMFYDILPGDGSATALNTVPDEFNLPFLFNDLAPARLECDADTGEETAWGGLIDFPGKNWARYFIYTVMGS